MSTIWNTKLNAFFRIYNFIFQKNDIYDNFLEYSLMKQVGRGQSILFWRPRPDILIQRF